jgi:hypothetical protein
VRCSPCVLSFLIDARSHSTESVQYLQLNTDDDGFLLPQTSDKQQTAGTKAISAASAALDLAPLAQTGQRFASKSAASSGLKTSEWPQFSGPPRSPGKPASGADSGSLIAPTASAGLHQQQMSPIHSRRTSPSLASAGGNLADSVASLPAMPLPSRSVPGTPAGPLTGNASGLASLTGMRRSGAAAGVAGGNALEGLTANQRGYSNPDLAKAFAKGASGYGAMADGPRVGVRFVQDQRVITLTSLTARSAVRGSRPSLRSNQRPSLQQRWSHWRWL